MSTTTKTRLNAEEAAEYVGLSVSTMRSYRSAGKGPVSYKIGRHVVYDVADLDAWLDQQKVQAVSEVQL